MYFSRVRIRPGNKALTILAEQLKGNSYVGHRLLWTLFPDQSERQFLFREEIAREQLGPVVSVRGEPVYYLVSQTPPVVSDDSLFSVETKPYRPQLHNSQRLSFDCRVNPVVCRQGKKHDIVMDAQLQFLSGQLNADNLDALLPAGPEKGDYKKLLLAQGGAALNARLTEILANNPRYVERLMQISTLTDKLEWALKAHIDTVLENWLQKQGEKFGFALEIDDDGLLKLQNSAYAWHGLNSKGKKAGFSSVDFTGELAITDTEKFAQALFQGIGRAKAFGCGLLMIRRI